MDKYIPQKKLAEWRESNKPDICVILGHKDYIPVVDHDHRTGKIRGVVSAEGNSLIGKIENFYRSRCVNCVWDLSSVLRAIADYLEQEQGPLHPVGARQLTRRFAKYNKSKQIKLLLEVGANKEDIDACKNSVMRSKLYRKIIVL
jgi:hypothetical protein